ncbi:MAG: Ig-like domain-containing protein [Bacillota bacterium]
MIHKQKWIYILIALTLIFTSLPFSAAQAVSLSEVEQLFNRFDTRNNGNWYKDYNNENGALAWDESYVMRGYLEMYQATKDTKYLDKFIVHGDSVLKQRDSVRGVKDYRGLSLPAWRGGPRYTGNGTYKIFDVHTAMIAYPFAQFATIVNHNSGLSSYKSYADKYLKAAKDAAAVHDAEWIETATEMYLNRPFNMIFSFGSLYLEIYQASGEAVYKNKAVKIANHFRNNLTVDSSINGYLWKYMRTRDYGYEDLSHGAMDIDFAYLAYKNSINFNATDMQRFGNTVQKKLIKADGNIANRVDGSGTSSNQNFIGLWLNLHSWAPSLFDASWKKVSAITSPQGEDLLSAAFLNRVYRERNGGLPTPPPVDGSPKITPNSVDGEYLKGQLTLTANVTDDGQVAKVTFAYGTSSNGPWTTIGDGELVSGSENSGTWSLNWGTENLADGTYFVRATAVDDKGAEAQGNLGKVVKDTTAPQVAKKSPENNGVVQLPGSVSVTFNEAVQNVNVNSLFIEGVSGQVKYDAGTKTAVFTPASPLKADTAYKAVLASGITDLAGNALVETTWTFQAAANAPGKDDVMINGSFTNGKTGWVGTDVTLKSEANGNQYGLAPYGWSFYQDLALAPGEYKLNAKTLKGTAATDARIVVMYIDGAGKRTVAHTITHKHKGTGWEAMPEQTITVPASAATTRIYLMVNGGSGAHGFDDISLTSNMTVPTPTPEPTVPSVMVNGSFTDGTSGWSGKSVSVKSEANGNKYGSAIYGWDFYQDLKLTPGAYKLNVRTKKGTSKTESRIVVMYIDAAGKRTVAHDIKHKHSGTGWESMNELVINVPKTAATTRIYLLTNGESGAHGFDDISLTSNMTVPTPTPEPTVPSVMVNGSFTDGTSGWSGKSVSVKSEANGNKYGSAIYGWDFYQDLKLTPGAYKLNVRTKKGTSKTESRIVVMYIDAAGKRTVAHDIKHKHSGTGWENMNELVINVPKTAVTTRIYLLTNGGTGYHNFDDITLVK